MSKAQFLAKFKAIYGKAKDAKGDWIRIPCQTCDVSDRHKMKRYVSTTRDHSHCWICCIDKPTSELIGDGNIKFDTKSTKRVEESTHPWAVSIPAIKTIPVNKLSARHPAIKFLTKDHLFDFEMYANEYGIVYCPSDAGIVLTEKPYTTSAERLIFPMVHGGKQVGWQMRSIPGTFYGDRPDVIKYYHLFSKGSYLFNYDKVKDNGNTIILVEGVKKALKLPNVAVASLGKGLSHEQIQLINSPHWKNVIVMLDADKNVKDTTQDEAMELVKGFKSAGKKAININLGHYNIPSPDEATSQELIDIITLECKYGGIKLHE